MRGWYVWISDSTFLHGNFSERVQAQLEESLRYKISFYCPTGGGLHEISRAYVHLYIYKGWFYVCGYNECEIACAPEYIPSSNSRI